jgi:hypothetical protein
MEGRYRKGTAMLVGALMAIHVANAQLPIAAKAGLVYLAESDVMLDGQLTRLRGEERVRVGNGHVFGVVHGRGELLLQPLNFLRLAEGASVEMIADELENVRLRIRGTAILDVSRISNSSAVAVDCQEAVVRIRRQGIYRLECQGEAGASVVKVYSGDAAVALGGVSFRLKRGQSLQLGRGDEVRRFDPGAVDSLDRWSAERSARARQLVRGRKALSTTTDQILRP